MKALFGILLIAGSLSSCVTPVTAKQWQTCENLCQSRGGVLEACVEPFKGPACHCKDDKVFWLDDLNKTVKKS